MDKQQLKPCPFCGGQAFTTYTTQDNGDNPHRLKRSLAVCKGCAASIQITGDEEKAAALWDRRTRQPPSASDERERFEAWQEKEAPGADLAHCGSLIADGPARESYRNMYVAERWIGWQARAALAPSPGVDAAEQKPVIKLHRWGEPGSSSETITISVVGPLPADGALLYAAPSPAASADEWMAEAERLVDRYADAAMKCETFAAVRGARAALLAHLKARP